MVEVECDSMAQVREAVMAGATLILCDNMSPEQVKEAVLVASQPPPGVARSLIEASGGVSLENVAAYAAAGADLISVGALTHSAPILDIGLDLA
jgi:nicotinate-nucleotide pyrophosphorylase (carboxylating)